MRYLVTGAGGFIGTHLVSRLKEQGHYVRGVDIKLPRYSKTDADDFFTLDLRHLHNARIAVNGMDRVFALAADVGGVGYLSSHDVLANNLMIDINMIRASKDVEKYLFASSSCIYPKYLQNKSDAVLRETDAYPADPQDSYGWEKLTAERLVQNGYIARFFNVYGSLDTWQGGREKVVAALCRKVAEAKLTGSRKVEIWGDGKQTRSFCHVDDIVTGVIKLINSDYHEPLNIGYEKLTSINDLAHMIADIAGIEIELKHVSGPQGVRGQKPDNTLIKEVLGWEPTISLEEGLPYDWVEEQYHDSLHNYDIRRWVGKIRKASRRFYQKKRT